jgi:hypothetical protein
MFRPFRFSKASIDRQITAFVRALLLNTAGGLRVAAAPLWAQGYL